MCEELCILPSAAAMAAFSKQTFRMKLYGFGPAAGEALGVHISVLALKWTAHHD